MTFSSLEKLIREEVRKVVENMERSFPLYEEEPADSTADAPAETPAETPKEEPAAEEKPEEKKEENPEEEKPDEEKEEDSSSEKKPEETDSKEKKEEPKKEEAPKEPNEEKTGLKTVGFLNKVDAEQLHIKSDGLYPEVRETLLQYDYENILDMYDSAISNKKIKLSKLYKKVESIALSKHGLISSGDLDKQTATALFHYYTNTDKINNIVRFSKPSMSQEEIEAQIKMGRPKEGDEREKQYNSAMNAFTIYELDYAFSEYPQALKSSILTYKSIQNENVLQMFIDAGQWVDKSFVTTSLNPLIVEGTGKKRLPLFEFFIPEGTSVLALPCGLNDYCHETEVTLPRNCRYTIQGFNEKRNIYKILVEQNHG